MDDRPLGNSESGKAKSPIFVEDSKGVTNPPAIVGTETIVSKNIFDPERGAGFTREVEANSQAFQRIRTMVLLGTAILGNNRFAILQDGSTSAGAPAVPGQSAATMRIKLGDTVEGLGCQRFRKKELFLPGGTSTVEVPLDYFRKTDGAQPRRPVAAPTGAAGPAPAPRIVTPGPTNVPGQRVPRAIPALPRRDRESSKED